MEVMVYLSVPVTVRDYPVPDAAMTKTLRKVMSALREIVMDNEGGLAIDRIEPLGQAVVSDR